MSSNRVYQRLLHAAKRIDAGGSMVHSAALGIPHRIYSYHHRRNIDIGNGTLRGLNQLKTQTVVGEYADPTLKHESFTEVVERYHALHPGDDDMGSVGVPNDDDLVHEFEILAAIADNVDTDDVGDIDGDDELDSDSDDDDDDDDQLVLNQMMNNNHLVLTPKNSMLGHIPGNEMDSVRWKGALLLQHPMSVEEICGQEAVPSMLLGIDVAAHWNPEKTVTEMAEDRVYHAIMLNQPSLLDLSYIINATTMPSNGGKKKKYSLTTSNGILTVPKIFHDEPVYIGGDSIENAEVITTSKFCKGIPIMDGNLFLNPDLCIAKRMIEAGHAEMNEFRFFLGKMKWDSELLSNVLQHRKMYAAFEVKKGTAQNMKDVVSALWKGNGSLESWVSTLHHAPCEWSSWIKIHEMMMRDTAELRKLKKIHKKNVGGQIVHGK